jgi:cyclophilin family peptidyl-prolyl cis-trans isomerase
LIDKTSNKPGTLSMANTGQPNSGGSQARNYIISLPASSLPSPRSVRFGSVRTHRAVRFQRRSLDRASPRRPPFPGLYTGSHTTAFAW